MRKVRPHEAWPVHPKGYDLTELAKHYPSYDETVSLLWFQEDSGPRWPVKNFTAGPIASNDGLKELDSQQLHR